VLQTRKSLTSGGKPTRSLLKIGALPTNFLYSKVYVWDASVT